MIFGAGGTNWTHELGVCAILSQMPRLSALNISALRDLAEQLRYAPREALLKQLERIEQLATEVDDERIYPEDWIVFRITGYRPDLASSTQIVGEALRRNLSALAERLADVARLTPADVGDGALGVEELRERWSVSRKTIDRYRRQGLIARRVRRESGHVQLLFTRAAVQRFEKRAGGKLQQAGSFSRMGAGLEEELFAEAQRLRMEEELSLNSAAKRLAMSSGRSHEAMRQLLRRHDEGADAPIFSETGPLSDQQRQLICRAHAWGVDPGRIAERVGRRPASVHRVLNECRVEALRGLELFCVEAPGFLKEDAEEKFLGPAPVRSELTVTAALDTESFIAGAREDPIPNRFVEQSIARGQQYLIFDARRRLAALPSSGQRPRDIDEIETRLRWATLLRGKLVRSQRRLALQTIEGRIGGSLMEQPAEAIQRLHTLAMDALIEAAAHFGAERGSRFAASAGIAVDRAIARAAVGPAEVAGRARRRHTQPVMLEDWTARVAEWQGLLDLPARHRERVIELGEEAGETIRARYGLGGEPPQTAREIAGKLGTSAGRVARLEHEGLRALRWG